MSSWQGTFSGVVTVVLLVTFLAIWIWAWQPWHRMTFDRLARLPLEESDDAPVAAQQRGPSSATREGQR